MTWSKIIEQAAKNLEHSLIQKDLNSHVNPLYPAVINTPRVLLDFCKNYPTEKTPHNICMPYFALYMAKQGGPFFRDRVSSNISLNSGKPFLL